MPGRAAVNRAPAGALDILGYVRAKTHLPQDAHEIPRVVRLIGALASSADNPPVYPCVAVADKRGSWRRRVRLGHRLALTARPRSRCDSRSTRGRDSSALLRARCPCDTAWPPGR